MKGNIKAPADRRNRQLVVRFTESEYASISSGAKNAGMSLSSYVRHLAVDGKVDVHYHLSHDSDDLGAILAQLGKIGSNLNQIARSPLHEDSYFFYPFIDIRQCIHQLYSHSHKSGNCRLIPAHYNKFIIPLFSEGFIYQFQFNPICPISFSYYCRDIKIENRYFS